jgi:hypothetical protein
MNVVEFVNCLDSVDFDPLVFIFFLNSTGYLVFMILMTLSMEKDWWNDHRRKLEILKNFASL